MLVLAFVFIIMLSYLNIILTYAVAESQEAFIGHNQTFQRPRDFFENK